MSEYNLKTPLTAMGLKSLIEEPGDLSAIIGPKSITLSEAIHKAVFKVTETGAEAAAATGFVSVPHIWVPPVEFKVDRPFLFLIRDKQTGLILFLGQVNSIR